MPEQTTLRRFLRMGFPELFCRVRQEAHKWAGRVKASPLLAFFQNLSLPSPAVSRAEFFRDAEGRFFPGPFDPALPELLKHSNSRALRELLQTADDLCRQRFDLLGYRDLDFGDPLDWHLDPVSVRRAPMRHWSQLNPLDFESLGDSKVIWELNRHQWMVVLGQAYLLTGEERYADTVVRHLRNWIATNPAGMGINWASSLEVAFRLIAWCWILMLLRDSRALTDEFFSEVLQSVQTHATHIERFFSYYFSPNTHLTGEALGLLYAGIVFPQLKHSGRRRELASRILLRELDRQVLSDGVHFERSTWYQRYTVDIYLHFLVLSSRAGLEVPARVATRVRSMLDVLMTLQHPDGSMPSIGDADGGSVLPLSRIDPASFQSTFSTAAVLFGKSEYAWSAGELSPDSLWLLGIPAAEDFTGLQATPPSSDLCRTFPEGGFAVMRTGWGRKDHSLIFDTGPLGCPVSSGHGHADLLSIQCAAFGQPYLVDAGTGCYADPELRDFFRGTPAHSTITVDGKSQAQPIGPFSWRNRCSGTLLRWTSSEAITFADAEHDGYRSLGDAVTHRRRVLFVKPRYWVLLDELTGQGTHRVELRYQYAPLDVRIDPEGWIRASADGRTGLLLSVLAAVPQSVELRTGCRAPLEGWVSREYGQMQPAPAAVYTSTSPLPLRLFTVLWPSGQVGTETPRVELLPRGAGLAFPDLGEAVLFDEENPRIESRSIPPRTAAGERIACPAS